MHRNDGSDYAWPRPVGRASPITHSSSMFLTPNGNGSLLTGEILDPSEPHASYIIDRTHVHTDTGVSQWP